MVIMKFSVNIKPKAKGRPRFVRRGSFVSTYTPKTTSDYEKTIREAFIEQCKGQYDKEYTGMIKMSIWAFFEPPKSYSKKKKLELLETPHLKKPDSDNIAKSILDALNGIAWKDDSQISDIDIHKYYDEEDKIIVEIEYVQRSEENEEK